MTAAEAQAQVLIRVRVRYTDGEEEEFQAAGPIQLPGNGQPGEGLLMIPMQRGGHVGIPLGVVKRWEATTSGLMVPPGAS